MSPRLLLPAMLAFAGPAFAQTAPTPTETAPVVVPPEASAVPPPIVAPLPTPIPTASFPVERPASAPLPTPTPTPTPSPVPSPTPRSAVAETVTRPAPTATPTASATPPSVSPTPASAPTEQAAAPAATPAIVPDSRPSQVLPIPPARGSAWTLPTVGGVLVAVALVAFVARRRRRRGDPVPDVIEPVPPAPAPDPSPAAAATPRPASPRGWLAIDLRPRRAGVNLLTATLDTEIVVRNEGEAAAEDIRVALHLLSARAGQEAELAQAFEAPAARPVTAPFTLQPGEERVLSAMATMPRGEIAVLTAGDRPMFVPLAAVSVRYRSEAAEGLTAGAFALGIEREGAAKLAPFRLDQPAQMHDRVAVRPHAPAIRR